MKTVKCTSHALTSGLDQEFKPASKRTGRARAILGLQDTRCTHGVETQPRSRKISNSSSERTQCQIRRSGVVIMTNSVSEVFASHHEVMEALRQNYAGNDDAQKITSVEKLQQDLAAQCQQKESNVRATITGKNRRERGDALRGTT